MCRPLPARPRVSPHSHEWTFEQAQPGRTPEVAELRVTGAESGDPNDGSLPFYSDPGVLGTVEHRVRCAGVPYSDSVCKKTRIAGALVRIPRGARPSGNSDHHLSIEDDAARREIDFWGASVPDESPRSTLDVLTGGQCAYDGDGSDCSGSTATQIASSLGAIDPATLASVESDPHGSLPYALATQLLCASPNYVYPAAFSDGANTDATPACRDHLGPGGRPPEGVRFFLDLSDAEIDATHDAPYVKALLRTLDREHYGGTVTDTNWSGAPGFAFVILRAGWPTLVRAAGLAAGTTSLRITTDGIDFAEKLRFCTNGTC
jgi:hypothetical protein